MGWPGSAASPLTVMVKEPSAPIWSWSLVSTAAVMPVSPVSTLKLVSAGGSPSKRPVITYVDVLLTAMKR